MPNTPTTSPKTGRFTWPLPDRTPGRHYIDGYTWTPPEGVQPAVLSVGRGQFDAPNGSTEWRCQNPNWVIDCPLVAGMRCRAKSTRRPWRAREPGELYLYPPALPYWERCAPGKSVNSIFIVFRGGEHAGLQELVDPVSGFARFRDPDGRAWRRLAQAVDMGLSDGHDGFWGVQARVCQLIEALRTGRAEEPGVYRLDVAPDTEDPRVAFRRAVDEHMRRHLSGGLTLAALAEAQKMSVSTFCRRYREASDEPPMARYLMLRLSNAKALLMKGEALKVIAHRTGFSDAFHFSRAFKQAFGYSPSAFRRSHGRTS